MKKVELTKGLSYMGKHVSFVKGVAQNVDDAKAEELVASGYFKVIGEVADEEDETLDAADEEEDDKSGEPQGVPSNKPVAKMNGTELRAYAADKGYDISECTKVEEIRTLIETLDAAE